MKNITVIGGGTGSFVVLSGLKKLKGINLTAITPSTDSGGSSGRLVDEFGYLPPGDVRQCLVALADEEEQSLLRQLFNYRFARGEDGLKGHHFGNLLLTALKDIYGNELDAIAAAEKLFDIKGKVYPVSLESCQLVAEYENGAKLTGEHNIDEPPYPHDGHLRIVKLYTEPEVKVCDAVAEVIKNSDFIVIGPGDLYSSLFANLVTGSLGDLVAKSNAKIIFLMNLVTKFGQTYGFKASDFLSEVKKYLGKEPDYVLVNSTKLPDQILTNYELENAYPVKNDLTGDPKIVELDLLATEEIVTSKGDVLKRSLIRHDEEKVAREIERIINL